MNSIDDAVSAIVARTAALSKQVLQQARHRSPADLAALERQAREASQQYGQALLAAALAQYQQHEPAPPCGHCGQPTVRHEARGRTVLTLLGPVTARLLSFRCSVCERTTPGAVRRDLVHGALPALAEVVGRCGARLTYRAAEATVADFGLQVSDNLLADLTQAVGNQVREVLAEEADQVAQGTLELVPPTPPERLYVEADGFKVQVVETGGRRSRPAETWREVRCGVCFTTAAAPPDARGRPPRLKQFSCRATWADCDGFDRWFYPEVQRQGVNQAAEVVILVDGAPWLREHLKGYVPPGGKVVEILDWYHATQNLAKATKARYGTDPAQSEAVWAEFKEALWEGRVSAVVRRLAAWLRAGEPGSKEVAEVVRYLWVNRARMRYPSLRAAGYHIGSGQVESLCKVLGQRVKGADRLWTRAGLEPVLALRCQMLTEEHQRPRAA